MSPIKSTIMKTYPLSGNLFSYITFYVAYVKEHLVNAMPEKFGEHHKSVQEWES